MVPSQEQLTDTPQSNHIDCLDPALLIPGRINCKIEYKLASQQQTYALFYCFFPAALFAEADASTHKVGKHFMVQYTLNTAELADSFAQKIPDHEFSVAELQWYLLDWKMKPADTLEGVEKRIEGKHAMRQDRKACETQRKERLMASKMQEQLKLSSAIIMGIGNAMAQGQVSSVEHPIPMVVASSGSMQDRSSSKVGTGTISPTTSGEGTDDTATKEQLNSPPEYLVPIIAPEAI